MKKHPAKFYSNFEYFITEVTKEMDKQDRITSAWLKAIGAVLGTHFLARLLVQDLKASMPIIIPMIGALSTGYTLQSELQKSIESYKKNKSTFNEPEEKQRLKKAQIIYQEQATKEDIDGLYQDLVAGEEILF